MLTGIPKYLRNLKSLVSTPAQIDNAVNKYVLDKDTTSSEVVIAGSGKRSNIWKYTEELNNEVYSTVNLTKTVKSITIDGIKLTAVNINNWYSMLYTNTQNMPSLVVGKKYLVSYFSYTNRDIFLASRELENVNNAFGKRLHSNSIRRHWTLLKATDTNKLTPVKNPTIVLGGETTNSLAWFMMGSTPSEAFDLYIGGFQIEMVSDDAIDGIAIIGDSTMAGASAKVDLSDSREVSRYLEAELRVNCFNRAVGGETLAQMDSRWATDITPLKVNSKYVIIQGGINDISQGRTLAQMQSSLTSMYNKALTDGFIPVFLTITPFETAHNDATKETLRQDYNSWLKTTFINVIDIAKIAENPLIPSKLNEYKGMNGDGTHYTEPLKRLIGFYIAGQSLWDFTKPSPYQKIETTIWTNGGNLTAGTGTALNGAFDANSATAQQAAQRVLALENILRNANLID